MLYLYKIMDVHQTCDVYKSNHYAVHLKLSVLYVSYISVKLEEKNKIKGMKSPYTLKIPCNFIC